MSDIGSLETRIAAAMERIRTGVSTLADNSAPAAGGDLVTLLEEERTANAQLEERVKALKVTLDGKVAGLEDRVAEQTRVMAGMETELLRLRATAADLSALTVELRTAAEAGVADATLINRALMAEVEALRADRGAEAAEVAAVLSELAPLVEGDDDATG